MARSPPVRACLVLTTTVSACASIKLLFAPRLVALGLGLCAPKTAAEPRSRHVKPRRSCTSEMRLFVYTGFGQPVSGMASKHIFPFW